MSETELIDSLLPADSLEVFTDAASGSEGAVHALADGVGGVVGQSIPYLLHNDEWVTGILLLCFFVTSYVFSSGKALFFQSVRRLFFNHEINHFFHPQATVDTYCLLFLNLQACLLLSVLMLKCMLDAPGSTLVSMLTPSVASRLLGGFTGLAILYMIVKRFSYKFVNWVFFDKAKNSLWLKAYFFVISILGILLFPVTLLVVYGNLPFYVNVAIPAFLFFLANLFFIYKCFSIFFRQSHGSFYLFLYFCTLEVLPLLVIWKGVEMVNDMLL